MGGLAHASGATERLPLHRGFRRMGIRTASGSKTEIAAPHSRIVRSRTSRDGGPAAAQPIGISPPMTIASPELQTPGPGRFSVLQV
jgi:hypothetical protein